MTLNWIWRRGPRFEGLENAKYLSIAIPPKYIMTWSGSTYSYPIYVANRSYLKITLISWS